MTREELIDVFKDTQNVYSSDGYKEALKLCISNTVIYEPSIFITHNLYKEEAVVKVTESDTFTAAQKYTDNGDNFVAVLNFASATNPGGGVLKGSSAQEEDLCRRSTLYPALTQKKCMEKYYEINRKGTNKGSDTVIYTRDVLVFKNKNYNMLDFDDRFYVDVITCAAPNLREYPQNQYNNDAAKERLTLTDEELYNIHVQRAKYIFNAAYRNGCTHIILGAFGCGAFKNNPRVVAKAYKDVIENGYKYYFKVIEFAIVGKNDNYKIFKEILG